jgi:peptidoglycan hydrolase CwlO-like protein
VRGEGLRISTGRAWLKATAVAVVLSCVLAAPMVAHASPTSDIKTREAQKAVILTELDGMRIELQARIDKLTSTGRTMGETQAEIDQINAQLAEVDVALQKSKAGLAARAAELYRSDRVGMIDVLLGSQNIEDLIVRTHYLLMISERDANALDEYRLTRSESLWLQDSLNRRLDRLKALQAQADAERIAVQADVTKAESRAAQIDADIAELLRQSQQQSGNTSGQFNPDTVISDANFRSQDMTASGIQTFLDQQPGPLKNYHTKDHAGVQKSAAEIIADAAQHYNVSPRVLLITMQKEQSLLSRTHATQYAYDWALGCGRPDSGAMVMQYKGFGKQVWGGAQKLDKWANFWTPNTQMPIDSSTVTPTNGATFAQYKYTPHIHGVTNFWTLWIRYFNTNPAL